jgi:hypothetical protein
VRGQADGSPEGPSVNDTSFILITIAFFVVAAAYAYFCEKVR